MMFSTAVLSSPGGRAYNEDCADYRAGDRGGCWVVADGLGGHRGGETAAAMAVDEILRAFDAAPAPTEAAMTRWIQAANCRILDAQRGEPELSDMRTTVAVLAADQKEAAWCHAGDTRVYSLENGRMQALTKDHSVPQAMADAGEIGADQIRFHEDRSRLLRALGTPSVKPAWSGRVLPLDAADAFLLCTDGFWEHCTETEMEAEFAKSPDPTDWLRRMEARIRRRASGEYDNYTAIAVFVNHGCGGAV